MPRRSGRSIEAAAARRRAARRPLQHGRRPRRHRASAGERGRAAAARATSTRRRSSKASASRRAAAEDTGIEVVIVRPTGIYGPGDRRLLKLFRGVARRRFPILGDGRIFYHLTYIDDLVEGFRLCGDASGRRRSHLHPRRRRGHHAQRAGRDRRREAHVPPPGCICRSGRSGSPARCARRSARRSASSRRSTAAGSTSSPRAARSTSAAARAELGYAPQRRPARRHRPDARVVPRQRLALR